MFKSCTIFRVVTLFCLLSIVVAALAPVAPARAASVRPPSVYTDAAVYRTTITLRQPKDVARLARLGVWVLTWQDNRAVVLANASDLSDLARLGFAPQAADELIGLVRGNGQRAASLAKALAPMLLRIEGAVDSLQSSEISRARALASVDQAVTSLSPQQLSGIALLASVDGDGDGLTNTQESWWCTNPANPDSDGDRVSDGLEVSRLRQGNTTDGPPFQAQPYSPTSTTCTDRDEDTVPDLAENMALGLNANRESTDGDKFDDGQEFFGLTKMDYGALPRAEDSFSTPNMPGWVDPPGDSPFVAAYPQINVDIIEDSFTVKLASTITTGQTHGVGEVRGYETSETKGVTVGMGKTETNTMQEWLETGNSVSDSYERSHYQSQMNSSYQQYSRAYSIGRSRDTEQGGQQEYTKTDTSSVGKTTNWRVGAEVSAEGKCHVALQCADLEVSVGAKVSADYGRSTTTENRRLTEERQSRSWQVKDHFSENYSGSHVSGSEVSQESGESVTVGRVLTSSQTRGTGREYSVATTLTREESEEHTVSQAHQFATQQEWSTATAVDTSHAADLAFQYKIRNTGTDYVRRIDNLLFNIYIGDDPVAISTYASVATGTSCTPVVITDRYPGGYFPASGNATQCGVPITLEQLKAIDNGAPIRVVVADFRYGDDQRFYENAWGGGVIFEIEDGVTDGNETVDTYLIPTWGTETYQDVLQRFFKEVQEEGDGRLRSIRTPEYNAYHEVSGWNWHPVSESSSWSLYLSKYEDSVVPFHERRAYPESRVFMRFDADTDEDGYGDRSEESIGTDPQNPGSHPTSSLVAGYTETQQRDTVTVQMAYQNLGNSDASGVEAVLYAADSSITPITHLTGGGGRVPAERRINLGSKIGDPGLGGWTGSAKPITGGQYTGGTNKTFTFTASGSGSVGQGTGLQLQWTDGAGQSGTLNIGSGYSPSLPLSVAEGLVIGLGSGDVTYGQSFTVPVSTPVDVFTYKVNRTPFTPPQIVVSYNDGQGNHKFVTPVKLKNLSESLTSRRNDMRQNPTLKIISADPFSATDLNTTFFYFNNPTGVTIRNAILLVAFATPEGENVAEKVVPTTLLPGPNTIPVTWRASEFSPAYQPGQDYKMVGFITDHSNVVIDTDLRYLSSLRRDPHPELAMSESAWDFGTVTQGEVLRKSFSYANTGTGILDTYLDKPSGLAVSGAVALKLEPGDAATFTVVIDTQRLPTAAYERMITLRTSDPRNSSRTIRITGTISPVTGGAASSPIEGRPWDRYVWVPGSHTQGDKVDFAHGITTDAAEIEPLYAYDSTRKTFRGVGASLPGHMPSSVFGDGRDGDLAVASGQTRFVDDVRTGVSAPAAAGQRTIPVVSTNGFSSGDNILVAQMQGSEAGKYEFGTIESVSAGQITLHRALQKSYEAGPGRCGGGFHAQFFNNRDLAGPPVVERCDPRLQFGWGGGSPDPRVQVDNFSARWVAQRLFAATGDYTFNVSVDDGVRIYVDDVLILNEWHPAPYNHYSVTRNIAAGVHIIRIEYYEEGGAAAIRLGRAGTSSTAQVLRVPQYRNVTIADRGALTSHSWDGGTGGIAAFRVSNLLSVQPGGKLTLTGKGFSGGYGKATGSGRTGEQGESPLGPGSEANAANGGGGGGSTAATIDSQGNYFLESSGAGGGGFGIAGQPGGDYGPSVFGPAGNAYGDAGAGMLHLGSGGGGAGATKPGYAPESSHGGGGGGALIAYASSADLRGVVSVDGADGMSVGNMSGGGGGGSGGKIVLLSRGMAAGANAVTSRGGAGGPGSNAPGNPEFNRGGDGGAGRIRIEYEATSGTIATTPAASMRQVNFYAMQKLDSASIRYTLPENFTGGRKYWMQFGQRHAYAAAGDHVFHARLRKATYTAASLDVLLTRLSSKPVAVCLDMGNNGVCDWNYSGSPATPATLPTTNLAAALNAYVRGATAGTDGMVSVPIRVRLDKAGEVILTNFAPSANRGVDLAVGSADVAFGTASPVEGQSVSVNTTLHNNGTADSGALGVGFYATAPGRRETYIGSAFVPNVPAGGTARASFAWNTLGLTGDVSVRVALDPFNRVLETNETNNVASKTVRVLTRPDLKVMRITLSNPEPVTGEVVTVAAVLRNVGQSAAGAHAVSLYRGHPESGGVLLAKQSLTSMSAGGSKTLNLSWKPTATGRYQLFARVDSAGQVAESDETNNDAWHDMYVGVRGPVLMNSGTAGGDVLYSPARGYGKVADGSTDSRVSCGTRTYETLLVSPDRKVTYRFDHLQPGHFYHVDVTLYKCGFSSRQESVLIDGRKVAGPEYLGDGAVHNLSILVDPAQYADRTIDVKIEAAGTAAALVGEVNLHDITYRYSDAGGTNDPAYSATRGYGWLPGSTGLRNDPLPLKSMRKNQLGNTVRYQYDRLDPRKRYRVNLSFWQPLGSDPVTQKVQVDGVNVSSRFTVGAATAITRVVDVPAAALADGRIVVSIVRTDAGDGALVNEISLEQRTNVIAPMLTAVSPTSVTRGGAAFTLTVTGAHFVPGSTVRWNGTARRTTFVSSTQLRAWIPATDIATAQSVTITVYTPAPGGGTSNAKTMLVK